MSLSLCSLDPNYEKIDFDSLELRVSNRLLNPSFYITKKDARYVLRLGAFVKRGGSKTFYPCISTLHNWLFVEDRIRLLPCDITNVIDKEIKKYNVDDISFASIISLNKLGLAGVDVVVDNAIMESANSKSNNIPLIDPSKDLKATLYPYQLRGVSWLNDSLAITGGAILADEMGLGKTLQVIAVMLNLKLDIKSPILIVCPTTLIANWCREIRRFSPKLTYLVHQGSERTGYYKNLMRSNVVISTYDTVVNDSVLFESIDWVCLVCDEAQAAKNPHSKRRIALSRIPRSNAIIVTGTPVENSLLDLWSLSDLAIPGILGSEEDFLANFPDSEESAQEINKIANTFVLKRKVEDVAGDLPERTDIDIPLNLDSAGVIEYNKIKESVIDKYGPVGNLVAVGQLSIYCAHPWLRSSSDDEVHVDTTSSHLLMSPKMRVCVELLREASISNKKVLVFVNFNECGDILQQAVSNNGIDFSYWGAINGSTMQQYRQTIVDDFTHVDGPAVLVLNPKAAGTGLNITAATIVIHYTLGWNPALEMQASARAHRRGQNQPVTIYRLFYLGTVEETMLGRSEWKRALGHHALPISQREKQDLNNALNLSPSEGNNGRVL